MKPNYFLDFLFPPHYTAWKTLITVKKITRVYIAEMFLKYVPDCFLHHKFQKKNYFKHSTAIQ